MHKKGCPKKEWDGHEGCSNWITMSIPLRENPLKKEARSQCIDKWYFDFQWAMLGLLEGNQVATETFRNAMVQVSPETGKPEPKPDPAMKKMLDIVSANQRESKKIDGPMKG
jgi:hypothetical protein